MGNTTHRMNHIFAQDGRTFVLAMDHGSNLNVLPALRHPGEMISELANAGADAFLATPGMVHQFAGSFHGKGIILRLDGGVSCLGDHKSPVRTVVSTEDALRLGADAVITMGFPGSRFENDILSALARNIQDAHRWNMPLMAEMLPRGFEGGDDARTPQNITFACRQGAELGADMIKTEYTGDQKSFAELVDSVYVPVVILGGAKRVPLEQLLTEVREALDAGAAGVAMGRNIWGSEAPVRSAAAIAKMIHENCSVQAAMKELNVSF